MVEFITNHGSEIKTGVSTEAQHEQKPIDAPLVVEDRALVTTEEKGSLHKGKRWLIGVATSTVMLIGAGLTAVGIYGSEDDVAPPASGEVIQGNSIEYPPVPSFIDRFSGLTASENIFSNDSVREMSRDDLRRLDKVKSGSGIELLPIPFNPKGQEIKSNIYKVSFDGKSEPTTGVLTFSGIKTGTEIFSPISGKAEIGDFALEGVQASKLITIRRVSNGEELIFQIFAPSDIELTSLVRDSEIEVGESLFKYGDTTKLNDKVGQSLEIHALKKNVGEDDLQALTQGINIITENGHALFIGK